jgi:pimeloyl-ACP methyl ester carboxylesterase
MPGSPAVEGSDLLHTFYQVDGLRFHAVEAGPEDGPLVLLLHGFPEFWYGWRHQIAPLAAAGYRVLAPDQRGYGESDKPKRLSAYRLDRLAADAAGLIAAAGRERAFVAAHDWGGMVAWWLAAQEPRRVERLAILNCPHPVVMRRCLRRDPAQRRRSWYIFFFQLPWLPEHRFRKDHFEIGVRSVKGTARPGTFSDDDMALYRRAWGQPGALSGMLAWYRAALRRPPPRLPGVRVSPPTLLVWGLRDRFLSAEMIEPSLALCDNARVERIPEASHWVQHEEPERVNRLLAEHFAG